MDTAERIDIGQKWSSGLSTFGIGLIQAIFHTRGKYDFLILPLIRKVNGPAIVSATILTNLTGILSGSVDESDLKDFSGGEVYT